MCKGCGAALTGRRTLWCSLSCKNKYYVTLNRRTTKARLVEHFGGACTRCGYNKCVAALHFHHPDSNKEFGLGAKGGTRAWATMLAEAEKCILICANCHAEEHSPVV